MPYLIIQTNARYFLSIADTIGKRCINYSWVNDNYKQLILIEGRDNIDKVKGIWDLIKNGIDRYAEGVEES